MKRRRLGGAEQIVAWALIVMLLFVWFAFVNRGGLGHTYYSGSARTLAENPKWLVSGAFDPVGFVTVDKPPIGLWPTALGVRLFGPSSLGFILPSAMLAAASAWFTSRVVDRKRAPLVALLVLCTPGVAVLARSSLPDATMLAAGTAAAAVILTRVSTARFVIAGFLLGIALLAKPGAVLMLPAFIIYVALHESASWRQFATLALTILGVVAFWAVLATSTPDRPYFGGTNSDNAIELFVGPGTISRVVDGDLTESGDRWIGITSAGEPGLFRTVSGRMGLQSGFLLVFALASGAAVLRRHDALSERPVVGFWLAWLVAHVIAYSALPGIAHAYYAASLGPAIAVLTVLGLRPGKAGWLSLVGLGVSLFLTAELISPASPFGGPLGLLALALFAAVGALLARANSEWDPVVVGGLVSIVAVMMSISIGHLLIDRHWSFDPAAGDESSLVNSSEAEVAALVASSGGAIAMDNEALASRLVAENGSSVVLVGGFLSRDPILTEAELLRRIDDGEVALIAAPQDSRSLAGRLLLGVQDRCSKATGFDGIWGCE